MERVPSKEELVLEFYNPHLRLGREGTFRNTMKRSLTSLEQISVHSPPKLVSFIDPLEDATKRDLRKSKLLHPLPSSPKKGTQKAPEMRCAKCFSTNVTLVPSCAYCDKLHVLGEVNTKVKRYAMAMVHKDPEISRYALLDAVFGYLHEVQGSLTSEPHEGSKALTTSDVNLLNEPSTKNTTVEWIKEAESPSSRKATKEAILEIKALSNEATSSTLSHASKVALVQYILETFSQPHKSALWTRERRWDHQDICLEMLKILPADDVADIMRTYHAWQHVKQVNDKQREMEQAWNERYAPCQSIEEPAILPDVQDDDDDSSEASRDLDQPPTLFQKKTMRVSVSTDRRRTLINKHHNHRHHNVLSNHICEVVPPADCAAPAEQVEEVPEPSYNEIILTAERFTTTSSNGLFHIDNLSYIEQAGLTPHELYRLVTCDKRTQLVYLLAEEEDRKTLLHLSSLGRINFVAEWLGKNIDNETILIAATSAKGALLTTEERRLLLSMDDTDTQYHLSLWKQMQHTKKPGVVRNFLHLNLPCHERAQMFHIPRYWQKLIKVRDTSIQPMPHTLIRPFILHIYERCAQEKIEEYDLVEFVIEHMTIAFGSATQTRLQGFITGLERYHTNDSWVYTFCQFCHVTHKLPSGCFRFYLSAILCIRFSVPNRSQMTDYSISKEVFNPLLALKAKMALAAISSDAAVDESHWNHKFHEMRTICPRAKGIKGNDLYVIGLSTFMDLVLSIYQENRSAMEKEMRTLFTQFDSDHNNNLSYNEFKAFITHCHLLLDEKNRSLHHEASAHRRASFRGAVQHRRMATSALDEKDIIKLYAKCLMQSDKDEVNIESFVLGGLDNPLILALFGFPVPPTHTSAARLMAMQLIKRAIRSGGIMPKVKTKSRARNVEAIAFILDDVLYDHTGTLSFLAVERAAKQLVLEGAFESWDDAHVALRKFREAFGYRQNFQRFIEDLVAGGELTPDAGDRVLTAYNARAFAYGAPHILPFPHTVSTLEQLRAKGYKLGLLCSGTNEAQWEKIHALGIASCFDNVMVVPAGNLSGDGNTTKVIPILKSMAKQLQVTLSKMALVGRRVFAELKAGKQIGLITIRMKYGKYSRTMPADSMEQPDYQMSAIEQLPTILNLVEERRPKPSIVALGGGTGLAVLLKALREYPADLTAIVTVFDSGRHSGTLRKTLGILPPGDIRNCLVALSDSDQLMNQLMNYRFQENYLEGASLGNLLLAALTDIHNGSFDKAVVSVSEILNIRGQVLPATLDQSELCATLKDGTTVVSEVNVRDPEKSSPIEHVYLQNADTIQAYPAAIQAIEDADIIIIAPGGFYTSIIATLLVPGIKEAIARSSGAVVYISNVATQNGQSDGYTLPDTLDILSNYLGADVVDYVIANNAVPANNLFTHGETLLLPTEAMENAERPILVQGRAFQDMSAFNVEWKKVPMIKHCGKMLMSMLYRIIEKEMDGTMLMRTRSQFIRIPSSFSPNYTPIDRHSLVHKSPESPSGPRPTATWKLALGLSFVSVLLLQHLRAHRH